jgi:pimeloyl-ACP methyl ester carboxylesterase
MPTILVGHSYGGAVISAVDPAEHDIKGLVYIAASAPDVGETLGSLMTANLAEATVAMDVDSDGYAWAADRDSLRLAFGRDLSADDVNVLFAAQKPLHVSLIDASPKHAAWRHLPSHYLVAEHDALFSPITQLFLAKRMNASLRRVRSGHMLPLAQPMSILNLILEVGGDQRQSSG